MVQSSLAPQAVFDAATLPETELIIVQSKEHAARQPACFLEKEYLNHAGAVFLPLPPEGRRYRVVAGTIRLGSHLTQLSCLLNRVALPSKEVLGQRVKDVDAETEVALADRDVHRDDLVLVWLVDLKGGLEHVEEVRELVVLDVLRPVGVKLLPDLVVHVIVVICEALLKYLKLLKLLMSLRFAIIIIIILRL